MVIENIKDRYAINLITNKHYKDDFLKYIQSVHILEYSASSSAFKTSSSGSMPAMMLFTNFTHASFPASSSWSPKASPRKATKPFNTN